MEAYFHFLISLAVVNGQLMVQQLLHLLVLTKSQNYFAGKAILKFLFNILVDVSFIIVDLIIKEYKKAHRPFVSIVH